MWKVVFPVLAAVLAVGFGAMVGGLRDMDIKDPGAMNALKFAVVKHNSGSNDLFRNEVAEVLSVQSQVVSGINYVITVRMGRTTCRKSSTDENCPISEDSEQAKSYTCTFTVWSQPWTNSIKLTKEECS